MKVALCLFGQPRLLDNLYTWQSQKFFILDRYKPDVFIHSWISGEERTFDYADSVSVVHPDLKTKEIKDSSNIIIKRYNPKKFIFEKPRNFSFDDITRKNLNDRFNYLKELGRDEFNWTENNENNYLSQLYSMSKSISLLNDNKYDWVILTRFDLYLKDFYNLHLLNNKKIYLDYLFPNSFNDVILVGSQEHIETLNCFDKISQLSHRVLSITPEQFKETAFFSKYSNNDIEFSLIGASVVRTKTLEKKVDYITQNF